MTPDEIAGLMHAAWTEGFYNGPDGGETAAEAWADSDTKKVCDRIRAGETSVKFPDRWSV